MLRILRFFVFGYWNKPERPKRIGPRKCAGYTSTVGSIEHCNGLASPLCWSGRCRHHCVDHCCCEKAGITQEEADLLRAHREEKKSLLEAVREASR
jgi:hypothetical protein